MGINNFVVSIVYFIIPTFIVMIVGLLTKVFANLVSISQKIILQSINGVNTGNYTALSINTFQPYLVNLFVASAITICVALIVFIIFSFIQTIAQARLANTGSLNEAFNLVETAKDIQKIGVVKLITLFVLIAVIMTFVDMVLSVIFNFMPFLAIFSIVIIPYLAIFTKRAYGLLYSDIV